MAIAVRYHLKSSILSTLFASRQALDSCRVSSRQMLRSCCLILNRVSSRHFHSFWKWSCCSIRVCRVWCELPFVGQYITSCMYMQCFRWSDWNNWIKWMGTDLYTWTIFMYYYVYVLCIHGPSWSWLYSFMTCAKGLTNVPDSSPVGRGNAPVSWMPAAHQIQQKKKKKVSLPLPAKVQEKEVHFCVYIWRNGCTLCFAGDAYLVLFSLVFLFAALQSQQLIVNT